MLTLCKYSTLVPGHNWIFCHIEIDPFHNQSLYTVSQRSQI